ncbi:MAG: hypothetical protein ACE37H_08645 [Phycisphaeraceae bacterium]
MPAARWLCPLAVLCLLVLPTDGQPAKPAPVGDAGEAAPEAEGNAAEQAQAPPIEKQVADLNAEIQKMQAELQKAERELRDKQRKERDSQPIPGLEEVRAATLPANPTREQCAAFIATLREACANRNRRSSSDLCVKKLREVPKAHIDLLIDEYSAQTSISWYVSQALSEQDNQAIRERITQTLNQYPNNINLVIAHGWCEDAKPAIIKALESGELPGRNWQEHGWWFQALVELQDPELYPKLHQFTVNADQWETYIEMLAILPDYDLARTINACIARQSKDDHRHHHHMIHHGWHSSRGGGMSPETAKIAAELGNIDGLAVLISAIPESGDYALRSNWNAAEPRLKALRFIRFRGSNDEIKRWFEKNREKLVFDHLTERFILPESGDAEADAARSERVEPHEPQHLTPDAGALAAPDDTDGAIQRIAE